MADVAARPAAGTAFAGDASRVTLGEVRVTFGEVRIARAWNVRGDASRPAFVAEASRSLGLPLPVHPNAATKTADASLLWLGPRSWLMVAGTEALATDFEITRNALNAVGGTLFDLSSSYVAWNVAGASSSRVLNRGCPLDLHPNVFPAGHCAQSVFGHINALIYRPDEPAAFLVMFARSFAADARTALLAAAQTEGYRTEQSAAFGTASPPIRDALPR